MKLDDLQALCAMAKAAGIKYLRQLRLLALLDDCKTNEDLITAVERAWDRKRALGLNES